MSRDLLVASTGGHLTELVELAERLEPASSAVRWVTFDGLQSRSLLKDASVSYVPYIGQRDLGRSLSTMVRARKIIGEFRPHRIISTGAAVATSFLPLARLYGAEAHYIESAARFTEPSVTGRILSTIPFVQVHAQDHGWRGDGWGVVSSVFSGFQAEDPGRFPGPPPGVRVVVTLGTLDRYRFDRLVHRLVSLLPEDAEVLWQIGAVPDLDLPGRVVPSLPAHELEQEIHAADLIVAHAGCGSVLTTLRAGKCPVVVPRRVAHGEHVDDHQLDVAEGLDRTGLVLYREVEDLEATDLWTAASTKITRSLNEPVLL